MQDLESPGTHGKDARPGRTDRAGNRRWITWRAVLLSLLSIAVMFIYVIQVSERQRSGSFTHSQYPLTAFIPFVTWLVLNVALKRACPRFALSRGELLTIFSMTWVAGIIPSWIKSWRRPS